MATTYTVTANPGNISATGTSSPVVVPGLTNGVEYTFIIKATNEIGDSVYSTPSRPVLIGGVPTVPLNFLVTSPTRYELEISWDPPASDGGVAIDSYIITITPGPIERRVTTSPYTEENLDDATLYTVTVKAFNDMGMSPATAPQSIYAGVVPDAPTIGTATLETDTSISVAFTPPVDDGGPHITGYTATSTPGSISNTGAASPIVVSGLDYDTSYTFHVHATNAIGDSTASSESGSVLTGPTVPDAPVLTDAVAGAGQVTVTWTIGDDNGSAITYFYVNRYVSGSYTYQSFVTGPSATSLVINSAAGVAATFRVFARNSVGDSALSNESSEVTPTAGVPTAPTLNSLSQQVGQIGLNYSAPSSNGGYNIQCYRFTAGDGTICAAPTAAAGWNIGVWTTPGSRSVTVAALNRNGVGASSGSLSQSIVVPNAGNTPPGAVTGVSAVSNSTGEATISFTTPHSPAGTGTLVGYQIIACREGGSSVTFSASTNNPRTVTGLVSGDHYRFLVRTSTTYTLGPMSDCSGDVVVL